VAGSVHRSAAVRRWLVAASVVSVVCVLAVAILLAGAGSSHPDIFDFRADDTDRVPGQPHQRQTERHAPGSPPEPPARPGLLHSPEEVEIWRQRTRTGPYRSSGDTSANSPGDWDRIQDNSARFLEEPSMARYGGPIEGDLGTCVQQGDSEPPVHEPGHLRDAAFVALLTERTTEANAVRKELLRQASEPGTDFANRARWCPGVLWDVNPSFMIANWLTKLLLAYDYLGPETFTPEERDLMDRWFRDAARFFQTDLDAALERNFEDRSENHRVHPSLQQDPQCSRVHYLDGPASCLIHQRYNNRHANNARFVGLVGLHQDDASLMQSGRAFVEEYLKFGVFPEGFVSDFERWQDDLPDLGWAYGAMTLGPVIVLADAFARAGDPSLYEYSTSVGAFGSEGGPKDLLFAARSFGEYLDGQRVRFGTDDPARRGDPEYLIDGSHESIGWHGVHDVFFAMANVYYRDPYIEGSYTRTGPDMPAYPDEASGGPYTIWNGEGGIFPGMLLMYGQMEGRVWPYGPCQRAGCPAPSP
jgi:hypothetical protein